MRTAGPVDAAIRANGQSARQYSVPDGSAAGLEKIRTGRKIRGIVCGRWGKVKSVHLETVVIAVKQPMQGVGDGRGTA